MALLAGKVVQRLGYHVGVVFEDGVAVALELFDAVAPPLHLGQLALGGPARLVRLAELRPQLLERDVPLGRHVLEPGALAV